MTSNLDDLISSSFRVIYHLGVQPTEVDNLTTYEMREYLRLTTEQLKSNSESDAGVFSAFKKMLGISSKRR